MTGIKGVGRSALNYRLDPGKLCAFQEKASNKMQLTMYYYSLLLLLTEEQSNIHQRAQMLS
jgi:hypothetical protein